MSLCHRCNHDRDCNDSEDEYGESNREMDQARLDIMEVDAVNYHEKRDDSDFGLVAGGLYLWAEWEYSHRVGYQFEDFCWRLEKLTDIYWQCKGLQARGWMDECWNWYQDSWSHRTVSWKNHLSTSRRLCL